jgi:hypothetical protein
MRRQINEEGVVDKLRKVLDKFRKCWINEEGME